MNLEVGKYYRDAEGNKVGPMDIWCRGVDNFWHELTTRKHIYKEDGSSDYNPALIAEWQDEPLGDEHLADQAARLGIVITAKIGEISIIYDGRDKA